AVGEFRCFFIDSNSTLSVSGITVENGSSSTPPVEGAIVNAGTLTITDSNLTNNALAINNYSGILTVTNCTFSGNKNLTGSSLGDPSSSLQNTGGTVRVTGSTFSGNFSLYGAAINNNSVGGFYSPGGQVTVTNSTFFNNYALVGAAIYNDVGSTLAVTNSTF